MRGDPTADRETAARGSAGLGANASAAAKMDVMSIGSECEDA